MALADRFPLRRTLRRASATTDGDHVVVSTGEVERVWRWTGAGLVTVSFRHLPSGREWAERPPSVAADCSVPGAGPTGGGRLLSLSACTDDDAGFTSRHLRIVADVERPDDSLAVRLVIWAYPDAPGLRTQLWVRGRPREGTGSPGRVDHLPLDPTGKRCRGIGYHNDTQHRNRPETPVLREEATDLGVCDWASVLCVEDGRGGVAMVKESHKCVNQPGVDTGAFLLDADGLHNTGWGLPTADLDDEFGWCWASWLLAYDGGAPERQRAIKRFDRLRFPPRAERDLWSVACTWGESENPRDGRDHATAAEVTAEMEATHASGIDLLLIDDGWQVGPAAAGWQPPQGQGWRPSPEGYPRGWAPVRERASALGMRLGLWAVAQHIPLEDMLWNWREIGMEQFKLDFASLRTHRDLDDLMRKVRQFVLGTGHRCLITWDTTENAPRYGYYWAREYGNVHFMNRKPHRPANVVYVPWLALRDFWQLAHYQNLNKWLLTVHNPEVVDPAQSDAHLHTAEYCVATALMGIPHFMALPRHYSPGARERVRRLLEIHARHRRRIFDGLVFPLGEEPNNAAWTGFQCRAGDSGYLTVFRERLAREATRDIALWGVPEGTTLCLSDLLTGATWEAVAGSEGEIPLRVEEPGDFRYLRYEEARPS